MGFLSIYGSQISILHKGTSKNPHSIPTDETTGHSTKLSTDDSQVAGYAALRKKFSSGQAEGYPRLKLCFIAYI
jgi:hypothetical protein